jgi:hypothetical protein
MSLARHRPFLPVVQSASFEQVILDVSAHDVVSTGTMLPRSGGQFCATALWACGMAMGLPQTWASEVAPASTVDAGGTVVLPHEAHKNAPIARASTFGRLKATLTQNSLFVARGTATHERRGYRSVSGAPPTRLTHRSSGRRSPRKCTP